MLLPGDGLIDARSGRRYSEAVQAPLMASETPLPNQFGRYQVVEELGSGAMGVVYLGVDPRLARPVAIKVMRDAELLEPKEREQFRARFQREAEAAGRISHPDIVQIYDVGPSYLVMEYLEGQTLTDALEASAGLTTRQVGSLVLRLADAIDFAHQHGIVHRDIKPGNIMLLNDGGVKVTDFGVARIESSTLTAAGAVLGSIRYMAPEQMMGEPVDARADIFSLGAMAYELLTGQAPYPGKTITEVVSMVVNGAHVPPLLVDSRLPEGLNAIFGRVLSASAAERYPRAMEFARQLYEVLQPVLDLEVHQEAAPPDPTEVDAVERTGSSRSGSLSGTTRSGSLSGSRPAETLLMNPVPSHQEGVLLLDSDPPGARVYIDGMPVGEAPLPGVDVTFGRHVLRLEIEGRDAVSTEVDVRRERPLKAITVTLPQLGSAEAELRPGQFVEFGPEVVPPRRIEGAAPVYPEAAREKGLQGAPVVELWISETGDVADVAIVESAGATLDGALLQAVTGWRFAPASLRGIPVSVRLTVQHLFR